MLTGKEILDNSTLLALENQCFYYRKNINNFVGNIDNTITDIIDKNTLQRVFEPKKQIKIPIASVRHHEYRAFGAWPNENFWGYEATLNESSAAHLFCPPLTYGYRIQGFYNFTENQTIGEIKDLILEKIIDRVIAHELVLASYVFINRVTTILIKFELILCCSKRLNAAEEILKGFVNIHNFAYHKWVEWTANSRGDWVDIHALRWQFWAYSEIFWNSNVLIGSSFVGSILCKSPDVIREHFQDNDNSVAFMYFFTDYLNSKALAWFNKQNSYYNFKLWLHVEDLPFCSFLLFGNRGSKYNLEQPPVNEKLSVSQGVVYPAAQIC